MTESNHRRAAAQEPSSVPADGGSALSEEHHSQEPASDLIELGSNWIQTQLERGRTTLALCLAESRLAASSLRWMLLLSLIAAVLALTAWGILVAAGVTGLYRAGVPIWAALGCLAAMHLLCTLGLLLRIQSLGNNLALPETRRQLFGKDQGKREEGDE